MTYTEDQYNAVLISTAVELQALTIAHAESIAAKDAEIDTLTASLTALQNFRDQMVQRVSAVLQSGDRTQYQALAIEFLTPAEEKIRAEKLAQLAALKAELGIE